MMPARMWTQPKREYCCCTGYTTVCFENSFSFKKSGEKFVTFLQKERIHSFILSRTPSHPLSQSPSSGLGVHPAAFPLGPLCNVERNCLCAV